MIRSLAAFIMISLMQIIAACGLAAQERSDFSVRTSDDINIFVRRIEDDRRVADLGPLLLINGGRPGVLASWDVDAGGPSTAALLARAGHTVYLMDARGFGRSQFTKEMEEGAEKGPIAVRSHEVVRDIAAVVEEVKRRHPYEQRLAAMGWATGSMWLGHYASLYPETFSHLILYQMIYGESEEHWSLQDIASAENPAIIDRARFDAFRCSTAEQAIGRLGEDTNDKAFLKRYAERALEGDRNAQDRSPPCFRFPSGPLADSLMMANGRPLFDVSAIASHVLILRSENDFWSLKDHATNLERHLQNARSVARREIPNASHYFHLIPEHRAEFVELVTGFTRKP